MWQALVEEAKDVWKIDQKWIPQINFRCYK